MIKFDLGVALLVRFKPTSNKVFSKHTYPCSRANVAMTFNGEPPPKRVVHINRNLNNVLSTNRSHIGIHTQKATTCSFEVLWEAAENQKVLPQNLFGYVSDPQNVVSPVLFLFANVEKGTLQRSSHAHNMSAGTQSHVLCG